MSQAEELMNTLVMSLYEHQHPVTDSDTYYIIDPISRKVENRSSKKNTIMQRDHNSERLTFECPRYIEGHDMSLCNATKIHYVNIDSVTKEERVDVYEVQDIALKSDDDNAVICTWLISRNATQLVGSLEFWIQYACTVDEELVYEWYTDVNNDISIKRTRNNASTVIEQYPDALERLKNEIISEIGSSVAPDIFDDEMEALRLATEMGLVDPITDENGVVLTYGDRAILTL